MNHLLHVVCIESVYVFFTALSSIMTPLALQGYWFESHLWLHSYNSISVQICQTLWQVSFIWHVTFIWHLSFIYMTCGMVSLRCCTQVLTCVIGSDSWHITYVDTCDTCTAGPLLIRRAQQLKKMGKVDHKRSRKFCLTF